MSDMSRQSKLSRAPEHMFDPEARLGDIASSPRDDLDKWDDAATSTVWCSQCQERLAQLPNIRTTENMAAPKYCPICTDDRARQRRQEH